MEHRIVLVGHGSISEAYVRAISAHPNAQICGVVGRNGEKAEAFAHKHSIEWHGTNLSEGAKQTRATAAIICTPNGLHYDGVMEASSLGLHCLCEKPLHISPTRQTEMIKSCKENGVKLAVSYMRRFSPHFQFLKAVMESGGLGRIVCVDVTIKHFREKIYYDSWHGTADMDGGGPFMQQGSHIIDLALWLCGGYRQVLQAARYQVFHDIEVEDHGYAVLQYANHAIGMIEASTACKGTGHESIEISGTLGTFKADFNQVLHFDVPNLENPMFHMEHLDNGQLIKLLTDDFLLSVEQDREPFVDGESGKLATELIQAIYFAAGEPVKMF